MDLAEKTETAAVQGDDGCPDESRAYAFHCPCTVIQNSTREERKHGERMQPIAENTHERESS
jgi:hypothetical protein